MTGLGTNLLIYNLKPTHDERGRVLNLRCVSPVPGGLLSRPVHPVKDNFPREEVKSVGVRVPIGRYPTESQ